MPVAIEIRRTLWHDQGLQALLGRLVLIYSDLLCC